MALPIQDPVDTDPIRLPGMKTARRAIELLEVLGVDQSWKSVADLRRITGIPSSSLHALLRDLRAAGWIDADGSRPRYRLGARALIVGGAYLRHDPVVPYAAEILERVRERAGCTAYHARLIGDHIVYLQIRDARDAPGDLSRSKPMLPAHATAAGKALLAHLSDAELSRTLHVPLRQLTAKTVVSMERLRVELDLVRSRGYAVERGQSNLESASVAAVVPSSQPPTDAIGCSVQNRRSTQADLNRLGRLVREAAEELCSRLANSE